MLMLLDSVDNLQKIKQRLLWDHHLVGVVVGARPLELNDEKVSLHKKQ